MTMDLTQAGQMLKWLDEERRKDKALIAALQERLDTQAHQLARQEEQFAALQKTTISLEAMLTHVTEATQSVEHYKAEVVRMLDERDEKRRKKQLDAEHTRQAEVSALKDEVARIGEELRRARVDEKFSGLQAEERRLGEGLQRLEAAVNEATKRTDERAQSIAYLEKQRVTEGRRITELEGQLPGLLKRIETAEVRIPFIEEAVQKEKARLETGLKELHVIEELRVADFRREQRVKKWENQAAEIRQQMDQLHEERDRFLQQFQRTKQALDSLEAFQSRVETRQNEVMEKQRLVEDRLRQQWEEWQAGMEKERQRQDLELKETWKHQERKNKEHDGRLKALEGRAQVQREQIVALWESLATLADSLQEPLQNLLGNWQEKAQAAKEL